MCIIAIKYTYIERVRYTFKKIVTNIAIIRVALWPFFLFLPFVFPCIWKSNFEHFDYLRI